MNPHICPRSQRFLKQTSPAITYNSVSSLKTPHFCLEKQHIIHCKADWWWINWRTSETIFCNDNPGLFSTVSRVSLGSTALQQWIPYAIALEIERDLIALKGKFSSFLSWYEGGRLSDSVIIGETLSDELQASTQTILSGGAGSSGGGEWSSPVSNPP